MVSRPSRYAKSCCRWQSIAACRRPWTRSESPARRSRSSGTKRRNSRSRGTSEAFMSELKKHRMLIGGRWVEPASGAWFESLNPFTAAPWALIPRGGKDDVDRAVAAAKSAFYDGEWRKLTATARGALLSRLGDLITAEAGKLAEIET